MEMANTRLTVMRGTEVNSHGDLTDVGLPLHKHVPAALVEKANVTFDRASQTRRTIRTIMCTVPGYTDVDDDDTIFDEGTGNYFTVQAIEKQPTLIGVQADLILTLQMRSGVSAASDG
jgi:hypothetical protein